MKRHLKRFKYFLKDSNKKPAFTILKDMVSLWYLKKEFPLHYLGRFLYRKGSPDPKNFMTQKQYRKLIDHVIKVHDANPDDTELLDNKLLFHKHCKKNNLPNPEIVSYSIDNIYHLQDRKQQINTPEELELFFEDLFNKTHLKKLCFKPMINRAGIGVMLISRDDLLKNINAIWESINGIDYIFQEVIIQHPEINKIYPKSINTIRIEAYKDSKGDNHTLGTLMRFGSNGSQVDNISQGGFFVDINSEKGALFKHGRTNLIHEGKLLPTHPDTGFVFENFKIPFFTESLNLAKEAAEKTPGYVYAWDIVITPNGPTLLEGNNYPSFTTGELSYGGYKNKEAFKEIFKDANIKYL